jgi:tetratricopeptide (TPR) repeat protein/tRNA A-37 threonylcarbamoyl transferase component Bud32
VSISDAERTDLSGAGLVEETLVDDGDAPDSGVRKTGKPLQRGQSLGRYVVLSRLGVGGMGIVYEAYDPELDRKLALKLLHPIRSRKASKEKTVEQRMRLLREAQAMARLTHPNVITVHDVGTHDEGVFVAMEFIDGGTLTEWIEKNPGWREVVSVLTRAAAGLSAAHAAGLIHRDFKPENVMVARDGRVLVMDFGLARGLGDPDEELPEGSPEDSLTTGTTGVLNTDLTRAGAIMGTPAYMAPEQHLGVAADAKSDQFSFCVSLWEALYRERPFGGDTPAALALQTTEGNLREPPKDTDVPSWIRRLVERGLSSHPDDRWPSMDALVKELSRDPTVAQRRRVTLGLGLAVVLGAGYGLSQVVSAEDAVCERSDQLAEVWDSAKKKQIERALRSTGRAYADATWNAVEQSLDAYAKEWGESRREACEATWVRGEQSEHVLDLRMQCLEGRRASLGALTELLSAADDDVLEHALESAQELPPVGRCNDLNLLASQVEAPVTEEQAILVAELRDQIDHARALQHAGKYEEGIELARAIDESAARSDYLPVKAEARLQLARLTKDSGDYDDAVRLMLEAIEVGERARHDELRADAWIALIPTVGVQQGEPGRAYELLAIADGATARLGGNQNSRQMQLAILRAGLLRQLDRLDEAAEEYRVAIEDHERAHTEETLVTVRLMHGLGEVLSRQGKYEQALERMQAALETETRLLGPDHPQRAGRLLSIGQTLGAMGRDEDGLEYHKKALALRERSLGPDHPRTASAHASVGNRLEQMGRYDEALVELHAALELKKKALGPEHPDLATTYNALGNAYHNIGKQEDALENLRRAVELSRRSLGEEHATVAFNTQNIGNVLKSMGDYEGSLVAYEKALAIKKKVLGPRHPSTAGTTHNMADLYMKMGDQGRALEMFTQALEIKREALGDKHPRLGSTLTGLGEFHLEIRKPAEALVYLEEALSIRENQPTGPQVLAGTRFLAAKALWDSGGDQERALSLAHKARDVNEELGEARVKELADVEAWLEKHGR